MMAVVACAWPCHMTRLGPAAAARRLPAARALSSVPHNDPFAAEIPQKPVITIPAKVYRRALKRYMEKTGAQPRKPWGPSPESNPGDRTKCVIKCRRQELNHFLGQTYDPYKKLPLASEHWMNGRKSNGDHFTFLPYKGAPFKVREGQMDGVDHKAGFEQFEGLDPRLVAALADCGFRRPTYVQLRAIPAVLSGESSIVASETGNGKTLAYLVPLVQQILDLKAALDLARRRDNSPFAVVVTPSRELATQVYNVATDVGSPLGLSVRLEHGRHLRRKAVTGKREPVDLLIGSMGGIVKLLGRDHRLYRRDNISHVVCDEADSLLDDTFNKLTVPFLSSMRATVSSSPARDVGGCQVTLVGATFPTNLGPILGNVIDTTDLTRITTSVLHRVPPHVRQMFVKAPGVGKEKYLLEAVADDVERRSKVIVFSNRTPTANFVCLFLNEQGIPCARLNGKMSEADRISEYERFVAGDANFLSCTDIASRGLDTRQARHVVNYDFPMNMSDYLHRVGRVGRVGSPAGCRVTSFVRDKAQIYLVQQLEKAVRSNSEIPNVNANIIRIIEHRAQRKVNREDDEAARE